MLECYYGVFMIGVVINMINVCFDVMVIVFIFDYGEVKVLFVDREFLEVVKDVLV